MKSEFLQEEIDLINNSKSKTKKHSKIYRLFSRVCNYILRRIKSIIFTLLYLFDKKAVVISYCNTKSCKFNFGDALNPRIVEILSKKRVYSYKDVLIKRGPVYAVIGSILNDIDVKNLEIWGSGFISDDGNFKKKPSKIHAVRGPLTRQRILELGIECPEVYGDPALLLPLIYTPKVSKEYVLGVIPHFVDKGNEYIKNLKNEYPEAVLIIDIEDQLKNVINNVNRCQYIASSSLHGLIVADAYDIPSLWIELSNNVIGNGFKFRDYMLSVNKNQLEPFRFIEKMELSNLITLFSHNKIKFDASKLLKSCPFLDESVVFEQDFLNENTLEDLQ